MWQNDCHSSTRLQEIQIPLYEENISAYLALKLSFRIAIFVTKIIRTDLLLIIYFSGEWRISHKYVKIKSTVLLAVLGGAGIRFHILKFSEAIFIFSTP